MKFGVNFDRAPKIEAEDPLTSLENLDSYIQTIEEVDSAVEVEAKSGRLLKKLKTIGLDYMPFVGIIKPLKEAGSGKQYITGDSLTRTQRTLYVAAALLRAAHWPLLIYAVTLIPAESRDQFWEGLKQFHLHIPPEAVDAGIMFGNSVALAQLGNAVYTLGTVAGEAKNLDGLFAKLAEKSSVFKKMSDFKSKLIAAINEHPNEWSALPREFTDSNQYLDLPKPV